VHTALKAKLRDYLIDREIYLDTMNMTGQSMLEFCEKWHRAKPTMLRGHSHSIFIFASFCLRSGITSIRPHGIISSSMMLLPTERRVIEQAFACKVTDLYGCEEVGLIGCECEKHDGLHVDMENLYVEIVDPKGLPVPDGQEGAVVVTSLIADAMPIIRYRMGDITSYRTQPCPCGRGLATINNVAGRVADFFVKPDGGLVAGVSLVERTLTKFPGIAQLQMVQPDLDRLILRIVRDPGYTAQTQQNIVDELKRSVGSRSVEIEFVEAIPQEHNGKYRFAISHVQNPFSVS
jgi:phenylacetate-CoA ligase